MEAKKTIELLALLALQKGGTVEVSEILLSARERNVATERPRARWRHMQ